MRYPEVGVVYTDLIQNFTKENKQVYDFYRSFDYPIMSNRNCCNNNSVVAARLFDLVGLYDEFFKVAEDYDMWLRMSEACAFYHIPEALFSYRIHGENESLTTKKEVWQACLHHLHQKRIKRTQGRPQSP
jgi:hypothetical protein